MPLEEWPSYVPLWDKWTTDGDYLFYILCGVWFGCIIEDLVHVSILVEHLNYFSSLLELLLVRIVHVSRQSL